jgi:hypothetical protein
MYDPQWDNFAFALKTGREVALTRTPIQLLTFLKDVQNKIIIGDGPNITVGSFEMIDVFTHLYDAIPYQDPLYYDNPTTQSNVEPEKKEFLQDKNNSNEFEKEKDSNEIEKERNLENQMKPRGRFQKKSQIIPDEDSAGWKADAHKNLPGFKQLYKHFPNADWYIMIDDDTYVFKTNLKRTLSKYNPNLPFYLGSSTSFIGCDGVFEWGKGPFFAHGGSGIILSRAAVEILVKNADVCIQKYRDCWAGDIRISLCLRDNGVLLTALSGLNGDPPNDKYHYGDPCVEPLTFHHLLISQIQELFKLDSLLQKKWNFFGFPRITMADVAHAFFPSTDASEILEYSDRVGSDLTHFPIESALECQQKCKWNSKCHSFVFDGTDCWLKSGIPPMTQHESFSSGVVLSHYICNR